MITNCLRLLKPYFQSQEKKFAISIIITILLLNIALVALFARLNQWNGATYNAIGEYQYNTFLKLLLEFVILILIYIPVVSVNNFSKQMLIYRARKYLTNYYISNWLKEQSFYKLIYWQDNHIDNPDQRISIDIEILISSAASLFFSFFSEILNLITFSVILWNINTNELISIPFIHLQTNVPTYIMCSCLLYCFIGTIITFKIGKPLIRLDFFSQMFEANFRRGLIRTSEYSEEIVQQKGENFEKSYLSGLIEIITQNSKQINIRSFYLSAWTSLYNNSAQVIPLIIASPLYFTKLIKIGALMQISSAFGSIKDSLSILILNYRTIANLKATTNRLNDLNKSIQELKDLQSSEIKYISSDNLIIENLTIQTNHTELLENININIQNKQRVAIIGSSGIGKTSLIRVIAGIWKDAKGTIYRPDEIYYVPQNTYLPIGTLREGILYPNSLDVANSYLEELLQKFHLQNLIKDLDLFDMNWQKKLSGGEKQRLALIRTILHNPKFVILDEPTSSINTKLEQKSFELLCTYLGKDATIITITHSENLAKLHDITFNLEQFYAE